jgi:serine/threonine protein phosphatase PrpC
VLARTIDHSHAQLLIDQGVLSEAQLRTHDSRNRLYCSLGGETLPHIDFGRRTVLQPGDVIALCSDGLWGVLDDEEIAERLARGPLVQVVPELVEQAEMEAGPNSDNVSLIAMRWEEGEPSLAPDTVSTETMALDQVTTAFSVPHQPTFSVEPMDAEEIERAIREINETIQKFKG